MNPKSQTGLKLFWTRHSVGANLRLAQSNFSPHHQKWCIIELVSSRDFQQTPYFCHSKNILYVGRRDFRPDHHSNRSTLVSSYEPPKISRWWLWYSGQMNQQTNKNHKQTNATENITSLTLSAEVIMIEYESVGIDLIKYVK